MKHLLTALILGSLCIACGPSEQPEQKQPVKTEPTELKESTIAYKGNSADTIYLRGAELKDLDPALAYAKNAHPPIEPGNKALWVKSPCLWYEAPTFEVEAFLNGEKPNDMDKKAVILNFWSSWCPPSRRSLPLMNHFQQKFKDDLIVINVSDESPDVINAFLKKYPHYDALFANDTMSRMKKNLTIYGVPHAILIEPKNRTVVWEGFPLLKGSELTDTIIQKTISIIKKSQN